MAPDLTVRKEQILKVIVTGYVSTAAPVASSTIARSGLGVSPATVRNEMVALEEDGYILRPHISAGGIPANKGYRYFVDTLDPFAPAGGQEATVIEIGLKQARPDFEAWAQSAASALASLLGTLAFATTPRSPAAAIKSVEILRLQEMTAMVVIVLREASIHRELISLDRALTDLEIEHTRNRITAVAAGKSADAIEKGAAGIRDAFEQQVFDTTLRALRQHEAAALGERIFQGLSKLFAQPELASRPEQARNVVAAIEDERTFAEFASHTPGDGTPVVLIGPEMSQEILHEFSVVVSRYSGLDQAQGLIGLVGPTRMHYERAVPAVWRTASALTAMAERVHGG